MNLARAVLDLVFPRSCVACGGAVESEGVTVCWDCRSELERVEDPFCSRCGDPVDGVVESRYVCGACTRMGWGFERARSALRYRGPVRAAIQALKYHQVTGVVQDLVPYLEACIRVHFDSVSLDGVACVPLYPLRERERTYNQAALLADGLADRLGVPRAPGVLRRVRRTLSQTGFDAGARRQNVRGAFVAEHARWLDGRTILLVDDVMTTGATVCECARMLLQGGAHRVYVATVARG